MDSNISLKKPEMPSNHFDPTDELSETEIAMCHDKVEQALAIDNNKELNLEKSDITIADQEWCLVSFIGKTCAQKSNELGMKLWGSFPDIATAKKHADKLSKVNPLFDIYILEMYCWARIPPDPECIDDQNYHEEKLHDLITDHKRQQMRAKEVFDLRKEKLMKNEDINRFNNNKQKLAELMGGPKIEEVVDEVSKDDKPKIQNEDAYKAIFGESVSMPKLEVLPENETSGIPAKFYSS